MDIISTHGIRKEYGGVIALSGADLTFKKGEVHALAGENGAGKSTLCKMLSGAISPTTGTITINGKDYAKLNPTESKEAGVSMIYQEFNLVNDVPVYENIFIGNEIRKTKLTVNKAEMKKRAKELFEQIGAEVDVNALPSKLSVAHCQLIEIAKALKDNAKVMIMDEPTAALTNSEIEILKTLIKKLKSEGMTIIYISHRMEEIMELSDRVTIMRDGQVIKTLNTSETSQNEIISMMVGRELGKVFPEREHDEGDVILEVKNLTTEKIQDVSFELRKGEILGFAGLVGSGRTETVRALFGADKVISGEVKLNGKTVNINKPSQAINSGIGMIPEDRKRQGVNLNQSIKANMTMLRQKDISRFFTVSKSKEKDITDNYTKALSIKAGSMEHEVSSLSGGNQQKIVLAKWLASEPEIIFFDEPTRGIDVGAKAEIYVLMNELRKSGKAIILISSELEEVIGMSDRIMVMYEGKVTGLVDRNDVTQEKIMELASNVIS